MFRGLEGQGRKELGTALSNLATVDLDEGKLAQAEGLITEAIEIQQELLGPDHPDVADSLRNLAALQRKQGRGEDARFSMEEVLRIRRASLAATSPLLGRTLQELGTHLMSLGAATEAEPVLLESVEILSTPPVLHASWLAHAEVALGKCLVARGKGEEGRIYVRRAAARMESAPGATAAELDMVRQTLRKLDGAPQPAGSD